MLAWLKKLLRDGAAAIGIIRRPELVGVLVAARPLPEAMEAGKIYIVGGPGYQKWAAFRCPKHEEEIVQLSLMQNRRPRWTIAMDFLDRPTIHPSVRRLDGAYAHFWVNSGYVDWCADTGRRPFLAAIK